MPGQGNPSSPEVREGGLFTWPFHTRHYELGAGGLVRPGVYLNWLQEVGLLASINGGWPLSRYESHGAFWWVRRFSMLWHDWVGYRQALEATTWISEFRRIRCHREYEIRTPEAGRLIFAAQAEWAFVDVRAGRPAPIPDDMTAAFPPRPQAALQRLEWPDQDPASPDVVHRGMRRVDRHELDTMGHVNNATYLVWLWDSLSAALDGREPRPRRVEIEYLQQVRGGEDLVVISRPIHGGPGCAVWQHEIRAQSADVPLARALTESDLV